MAAIAAGDNIPPSLHDFKALPELTNAQMSEFYWDSPHKQILTDFKATVSEVHDGDTITVATEFRDFGTKIRFARIDTKELNEGGSNAGDYTRDRLLGKSIDVLIDKDNRVGKYGRLIGEIIVGGINLNDELVRIGLAKPFSQRGEGKLPNTEKEFNLRQWF